MTYKPENPRAFPLPVSDNNLGYEGMSLRDYFATKALVGLLGRDWSRTKHNDDTQLIRQWAESAYIVADVMLKEREKNS